MAGYLKHRKTPIIIMSSSRFVSGSVLTLTTLLFVFSSACCYITAASMTEYPTSSADWEPLTQCHSPVEWFDKAVNRCRPCSKCVLERGKFLLEPCSVYTDTQCIDTRSLGFTDIIGNRKTPSLSENDDEISATVSIGDRIDKLRYQATASRTNHVTHEVEFSNPDSSLSAEGNQAYPALAKEGLQAQSIQQQTYGDSSNNPHEVWSVTTLAMLGIIAAVVLTIAVVLVVRQIRRRSQNGGGGQRKPEFKLLATRSRLFSRDRLDTSEYIHSLATLDRKMAMDEILEKRREAILATEATSGDGVNSYGDEVFVDMMGPTEEEESHEQEARLMQKCDTR